MQDQTPKDKKAAQRTRRYLDYNTNFSSFDYTDASMFTPYREKNIDYIPKRSELDFLTLWDRNSDNNTPEDQKPVQAVPKNVGNSNSFSS